MIEKNNDYVGWNFGGRARRFHFEAAFCDPAFSLTVNDTEPKPFHHHQGGHWPHSCGQFGEEDHEKRKC